MEPLIRPEVQILIVREKEIIKIATQLLSGMVANPHLYTVVSDEESRGHQEQLLILNAVRMAEALMDRIESLGSY